MLDSETKSRIDSARDILVGKVPDPKSQVEQITIALIYKFMDDMDRQSEEIGGKVTFFTGDFKKYRWANLLDKRLSGHERLLLYAEGIEKMNVNKNIPQLFRDIFKGVFLPYRDPETLNLFLKEINGFSYDHSERLGDAFEYLLSVLDTQGDAGQFRTPRHIIDFIVAVVDPQKHETVLDPACGTAGFLISSFKHIVRNNENLTPDERARLMTSFRGYDIAPDMVRLSRANLYLHGFANPVIHEYDTLTSEERWDERCDVILANPPFMTPKGGIRPHNRFSIKAKRSEVLFVDYMAEHLNPSGRAGIIVPEGIIFQSQNAYKALRKMLVENYLWAVVSLPAGVFNPYSGVKTSILFLDRNLARRTDELLLVKVESDGFDLGAQRRPIEINDLPEALQILEGHKKAQKAQEGKMALTVSRKRLLESGDINLSGDRYRKAAAVQSKWPMVKLGEVCELTGGGTPSKEEKSFWTDGTIKWLSAKHINDQHSVVGWELITEQAVRDSATNIIPANAVVVVTRVSVGKLTLLPEPMAINQDLTGLVVRDATFLNTTFLFWVIKGCITRIVDAAQGLGVKGVTRQFVADIEIPRPPLEEQERIVAELDGYRRVIEGARQVINNYKPTIKIDPTWPMLSIGGLCKRIQYGLSSSLNTKGIGYKTFRMNEIVNGIAVDVGQMKYADISNAEFAKYELAKGDILFNRTNSYEHVGRTGIFLLDGEYAFASYLVRLTLDQQRVNPMFLNLLMNTPDFQQGIKGYASRAIGQANINASSLASYEIPLPPIEIQRQIVAEIEAERALVESNRKLVEIFEKKIQTKLAEIWGENED